MSHQFEYFSKKRQTYPTYPPTPAASNTSPAMLNRRLALQRTIGNQAVIRQARPIQTLSTPKIQRSDELAVAQVELDPLTGLISQTHIPTKDRPEGPIKGEEGSHTTAYSAFVEGIRQQIQGKTVQQAINVMDRLTQDAYGLPGAQHRHSDFLTAERKRKFDEAEDRLISIQVRNWFDPTLTNLQRLIGAYLAYRNILPLSTTKRGGYANSGRESKAFQILRNYQNETRKKIRKALFDLLDKKALQEFYNETDENFEIDEETDEIVNVWTPGLQLGETPSSRVLEVLHQHLQSMRSLFPAAYEKAQFDQQKIFDEYMFLEDEQDDEFDLGGTGLYADKVQIPGNPLLALPPNATTVNSGFSVRVDLKSSGMGLNYHVDGIDVGGRPRGLFGGKDKKHTSAWAIFVDGLRNRLEGRNVGQAIYQLNQMRGEALALPGNRMINHLPDETLADYQTALNALNTARTATNNAWDQYYEITDNGANLSQKTEFMILHAALQNYVRAYLAFRNLIPLSSVYLTNEESTTGAKGEARALAKSAQQNIIRLHRSTRTRSLPRCGNCSILARPAKFTR